MYQEMYLRLFKNVTSAIEELEAGKIIAAYERLKQAQRETEEIYISEAPSEDA